MTPPVQLRLSADGDVLDPGGDNPFSDADLRELSARSGTFTVDEPRLPRARVTGGRRSVVVTALSLERFDESIDRLPTDVGRRWARHPGARRRRDLAAHHPVSAPGHPDGDDGDPDRRAANCRPTSTLRADRARPPSSPTALDLMLARLRSTIDDSERAARSAEEARDAMRRFLADMSHELRTPLTALKGYSDLYAGGMLDEPGALDRAMSRIGDESERLNGLVTDMLQLAREAPSTNRPSSFDATDVVEVVATDLRAAHPTVDIHLDVTPDARTTITGRPGRFHQAMLNLGSNACRHAAPGTPVRFVVTSTDTELVVRVIDHGRGVDPGEADRIFLPFYRSETARERNGGGGAGLGLAIASQIVERHHGDITVEPTPGGGATFVITIPLADD